MFTTHELLTRSEEKYLLAMSRQGDREAENRLVSMNQRLVYQWAARFYNVGIGGDQTIDDLLQWGNIGLLRAIRKYEPAKGVVLSTYASWWIRSSIKRFGLARGLSFGVSYKFLERMQSVRRSRSNIKGIEDPGAHGIAEDTGMPVETVKDVLAVMAPLDYLDRPLEFNVKDGNTLGEETPDPSMDTEEEASQRALLHQLMQFVNCLPPSMATILKHRYQLNDAHFYTYVELGKKLKMSRGRVQQLEVMALGILRREFAEIE